MLGVVVLLFVANNQLIDGAASSMISRIDGLVLLAFFVIFLYYIFGTAFKTNENKTEAAVTNFKPVLATLQIIGGMAGLVIGLYLGIKRWQEYSSCLAALKKKEARVSQFGILVI